MRQYHLLNAEWRYEQVLIEERLWPIVAVQIGKDGPDATTFYRFLRKSAADDIDQGEMVFHSAAASLGAR